MERYLALLVLTLDTAALVFCSTDYAKQVKPFKLNFLEFYGGFGRDCRTRNPHGTTQMHPLVKSLGRQRFLCLEHFTISLQKVGVVFRDLTTAL